MGRLLDPPGGAVLGVVVGVLVTVAVAASGFADPGPEPSPEAAQAFVGAWRRSRTATYVVEGTFERRPTGGEGGLSSEVKTVQRPPDRLVIGAGSVSGRLDGRRVACASDEEGTLHCRAGERVGAYGDAVDREVAAVRGAVTGPAAAYDVTDVGDGCFAVRRLVGPAPAPAWGLRARFCFDAATGAPTLTVIERRGSTDRTGAERVTGTVTDGDLELPAELA